MQRSFLEIYNDELRFLHEEGARYALAHPQVAQHLAVTAGTIHDPFVERLLEGTAFLTSRIHQRLNTEQAAFAEQMLARLAPGWLTPSPAIGTIALEPDFSSPQFGADTRLPAGARIAMTDVSLPHGSAIFTTCREVRLLPLEIAGARCTTVPPLLPAGAQRACKGAKACLQLTLSTRGVSSIGALQFGKLSLTFTGNDARANRLLELLSGHTTNLVAWLGQAVATGERRCVILPPSSIVPSGLGENDAILPAQVGELPGCRLLREYFASPSAFYGVDIDGLAACSELVPDANELHLLFVLDEAAGDLLDDIAPADFSLFATPVVNLFSTRCSPLLIDDTRSEQHIVVDRLRPDRYEIHHVTCVTGVDRADREVHCQPLHGCMDAGAERPGVAYEIHRRRRHHGSAPQRRGALNDEKFLTFSQSDAAGGADELRTILIEAAVCQRDFDPVRLQRPALSIDRALPQRGVSFIRTPSTPRPAPDEAQAWRAVQALNGNPLGRALPQVADCGPDLRAWLETFAMPGDATDAKRIGSIAHASIEHNFALLPGPGPLAWVRNARVRIDLHTANHADHGGYLFARVIERGLTDYCDLNQTLSLHVSYDGQSRDVAGENHVGR